MRYVKAKYEKHVKELSYRIYITDFMYTYGDGKRLTQRFYDMAYKPNKEIDNRTGDEIALEVIKNIGLNINECI